MNVSKDFAGTTLHKRGDDYEEFKKVLGDDLVEFACKLYPQIRHHIDYVEVATPMTNNYYLGQGRNSIHACQRHFRLSGWEKANRY